MCASENVPLPGTSKEMLLKHNQQTFQLQYIHDITRAVTMSVAVSVCQPVICTSAGPHREEPVRMLRV